MNKFYIPPSKVEAEAGPLPSVDEFKRRPSNRLKVGDLLFLEKQMWRIKAKVESKWTDAFIHTLYPCTGGTPIKRDIYPNEWVRSYINHDEKDEK